MRRFLFTLAPLAVIAAAALMVSAQAPQGKDGGKDGGAPYGFLETPH